MVLHFNYNCQLCKQNFNNCVSLTAHLKHKHKNEMSYETYYLKYMNTKSIPGECVQDDITSPFCIKEICDKKEKTLLDRYGNSCYFKTENFKQKCKKTLNDNYNVNSVFEIKEVRTKMKRKIKYDNLWFDSKPELAYYIWLKDNNIRFEYHPTLLYYSYNDKLYPHEPDFKVFNTYIEIKGNHFFKDHDPNKEMICIYTKNKTEDQIKLANELAEAKHQYMLNNGIKIITNYDKYIHYVEHKYGKHYLNMLKEKSKSAV